MNFVEKVFGTHSDRELKYIYPIIDKIEKLRPTMQAIPFYPSRGSYPRIHGLSNAGAGFYPHDAWFISHQATAYKFLYLNRF